MVVERDDVAYVGRIFDEFYMVAIYSNNPNFAIPIIRDSRYDLVLSRGAFTEMNQGLYIDDYGYASFALTGTPTRSGNDIISDVNINFIYKGGFNTNRLRYGNSDSSSCSTQVVISQPSSAASSSYQWRFTPLDPAGYGNDTSLLAGVRYRITPVESRSLSIVYSNDSYDSTTGLYKLNFDALGNLVISSCMRLEDVQWMLIPSRIDRWLVSRPSTRSLMPTVSISQCAVIPNLSFCSTPEPWVNNRGFSSIADAQAIIYFYSEDGTCGQSYSFVNNRGQTVQVTSSNGNSCDNCGYNGIEFSCGGVYELPPEQEGLPPPPPLPTESDTPPPTTSEEDEGLLDKWWVWVILGIVVFVILIVIGIVIYYILNKSNDKVESEESVILNQ